MCIRDRSRKSLSLSNLSVSLIFILHLFRFNHDCYAYIVGTIQGWLGGFIRNLDMLSVFCGQYLLLCSISKCVTHYNTFNLAAAKCQCALRFDCCQDFALFDKPEIYRSVCSVIIPQRIPNLSTKTTRQEL